MEKTMENQRNRMSVKFSNKKTNKKIDIKN